MELIEFKGSNYPKFQSSGFAARFIFPFALEVCKGKGYDIGCGNIEWALPGSWAIDISHGKEFHALNLPEKGVDYIFSSHCLEHLDNWVTVLGYWTEYLKSGGILFLYLPDYSQKYWRPWNNIKHKNIFTPGIIGDYMRDNNYTNVFQSGVDLNNSFAAYGQKV